MGQGYVITVAGAESSGKTTLAQWLAEELGAVYIPEYARSYLEKLQVPYTWDDLMTIATHQCRIIDDTLNDHKKSLPDENRKACQQVGELLVNYQMHLQNDLKNNWRSQDVDYYVIDGGVINLRLWAAIKYQRQIHEVEAAWENDKTDLYILCRPGVMWEEDPLREAPSLLERAWIYNRYLDTLEKSQRQYVIYDALSNAIPFR